MSKVKEVKQMREDYDETIQVCKFSSEPAPEEVLFSTAGICYVLDLSTFVALQSELEDCGCTIIDLPFSRYVKSRSEAIRIIANAINYRKCHVTTKTLEEIAKAEELGILHKGTGKFARDYLCVLESDCEFENSFLQRYLEKNNVASECDVAEAYFLVWDAMKLLNAEHSNVYIISLDETVKEVGSANDVGVVSPWKIELSL